MMPTSTARLDKIAGRYWGRLLNCGRTIVPENGWYEWTGEKPNKQPWHIHRADGELLYMAALTAWGAPGDDENATGFAIVTDDAEGGMIVCMTVAPSSSTPTMPPRWTRTYRASRLQNWPGLSPSAR